MNLYWIFFIPFVVFGDFRNFTVLNKAVNGTYLLSYIRANNDTSSVHVFIGASHVFSLPTVLLVHSLNKDYVVPLADSVDIVVIEKTKAYSLIVCKLMEYDDFLDKGHLYFYAKDSVITSDLVDWNWNLVSSSNYTTINGGNLFELTFNGTNNKYKSGRISLIFRMSDINERSPSLPYLNFLGGLSVQVEILLDNITTHFNQSRFALELGFTSEFELNEKDGFRIENVYSFNDEVTPTNFRMVNVLLDESNITKPNYTQSNVTGFVQIKPLCYTDYTVRDAKFSRSVYMDTYMQSRKPRDISYEKSIIHAFYKNNSSFSLRLINISMGTPSDGFYKESKFMSWTLSTGFGHPPIDLFSKLVIGLIFFSFLIILCSIIIGIGLTYYMHKRAHHDVQFNTLEKNPVA